MFRLGLVEIVVIIFVCIIVIKPEELPFFLKKIGKIYGDMKKSYDDICKIKDDFVKIAETEHDLVSSKEKENSKG